MAATRPSYGKRSDALEKDEVGSGRVRKKDRRVRRTNMKERRGGVCQRGTKVARLFN